ncbi:MAG: transcriptional regulator [Geobacteraceae bacterium]|nr:transcriptional regulator [Geobacteraceae bacterium]
MLRLLVLAALGYLFFFFVRILLRRQQVARPSADKGVEAFRDPVCGTYVTMDDAIVGRLENGEKLYFCSMECLDKYRDSLANKNT